MKTYTGHTFIRTEGRPVAGSSDIGNVSYCCPTIQTATGLAAPGEDWKYRPHTQEFAERTGSAVALKNCMDFIKGFTITAIDLMREPEHLLRIKEEFAHVNDEKDFDGFESPF